MMSNVLAITVQDFEYIIYITCFLLQRGKHNYIEKKNANTI